MPLVRSFHVYGEVKRLEEELQDLAKQVSRNDARRINLFVNYYKRWWCKHIGPASFSVFNIPQTTNNRLER